MKTPDEQHRELLKDAYAAAGVDFLAYKLKRVFMRIETPEDIALHNDVLDEMLIMIEADMPGFFRKLANIVLRREPKKASWLKKIAENIMIISR